MQVLGQTLVVHVDTMATIFWSLDRLQYV